MTAGDPPLQDRAKSRTTRVRNVRGYHSIRRLSNVRALPMKWLIYLRGGPLHAQVFESASLLGAVRLNPDLEQYEWTPERITHPDTGRSAQVWAHKHKVS